MHQMLSHQKIIKEVSGALRRHGLAQRGTVIVVGVSGGADSVCLLHCLHTIAGDTGLKLHVAHLNHGLRGREGKQDAEYVRSLALKFKLPYTIGEKDTFAYQKAKRLSLEEAAREVRYSFFTQVAAEVGTDLISVGHTANDQAETVLMHMIRGAGLKGLGGMDELSTWKEKGLGKKVGIFRPLLEVTRDETSSYCKSLVLKPRSDSSNLSRSFLRNRIRAELLPLLQTYNPSIVRSLCNLAGIVRLDEQDLQAHATTTLNSAARSDKRGVFLQVTPLLASSKGTRARIIRAAFQNVSGTTRDFSKGQTQLADNLISMKPGASVSLSKEVLGCRLYDKIWIGKGMPPCPLPELPEISGIKIPGLARAGRWIIETSILEGAVIPQKGHDPFTAYLDCKRANIRGGLSVRAWQPGDRFRILGMSEPKKLQDFFVDRRIPRSWRQRVPLICGKDQILWVAGYEISDTAKVVKTTAKTLVIKLKSKNVQTDNQL